MFNYREYADKPEGQRFAVWKASQAFQTYIQQVNPYMSVSRERFLKNKALEVGFLLGFKVDTPTIFAHLVDEYVDCEDLAKEANEQSRIRIAVHRFLRDNRDNRDAA